MPVVEQRCIELSHSIASEFCRARHHTIRDLSMRMKVAAPSCILFPS